MRLFPILIILFLCIACSQDSDTEEVPFSDAEVEILFSPSGFGDSGYNDIILYGIRQSCKKYGFKLTMRRPHSVDKGWELYEEWRRKVSEDHKKLFIFASNEYEQLLRAAPPAQQPNKSILLFEAAEGIEHVAAFRLEMYGAAYYLGRLVANTVSSAAILLPNRADQNLKRCLDGFKEGYLETNGILDFGEYYLADNIGQGYNMPDSAYRMAYVMFQDYSFVFPVAGGSNNGVLRYTREYPRGIYTAGVDGDMSGFSTRVLASLVKRIDWVIEQYIANWLKGETMDGFVSYGLDSDFIEVVIADNYKAFYEPILQGLEEKAIKREQHYVEQY